MTMPALWSRLVDFVLKSYAALQHEGPVAAKPFLYHRIAMQKEMPESKACSPALQ
jgi:hypothetical protein